MVKDKTMNRNAAVRGVKLGALLLGALLLGTPQVVVLEAAVPPNFAKTLAAQQQLVVDRPFDTEVYNDYGNLLVLAGRHDEAAAAYRRAIELAPDATLARYNLGILLQQTGHRKEALAEFQALLDIAPKHARTHYQLGMLFHSRKQRNKALEHYARAFAYDPEMTFAAINPHIIDNDLATEAILMSRRYGESPSTTVPRLYGEPDRIADLMLAGDAEPLPEAAVTPAPSDEDENGDEGMAAKATAQFEDDEERPGADFADEEDSEDGSRRALTREDLDAGSSVGQAQDAPGRSSRRSSSRSSQGRDGLTAIRLRGRESPDESTVKERSDGRDQGRSPRYRPGTRFSTGRLNLELLPAGPPPPREAATAAR